MLMLVFEMIVWIVAIGVLGGVLSEYFKSKRKVAETATNSQADERIKQLEERVKVLERLATDKGSRLSDEIDQL